MLSPVDSSWSSIIVPVVNISACLSKGVALLVLVFTRRKRWYFKLRKPAEMDYQVHLFLGIKNVRVIYWNNKLLHVIEWQAETESVYELTRRLIYVSLCKTLQNIHCDFKRCGVWNCLSQQQVFLQLAICFLYITSFVLIKGLQLADFLKQFIHSFILGFRFH